MGAVAVTHVLLAEASARSFKICSLQRVCRLRVRFLKFSLTWHFTDEAPVRGPWGRRFKFACTAFFVLSAFSFGRKLDRFPGHCNYMCTAMRARCSVRYEGLQWTIFLLIG